MRSRLLPRCRAKTCLEKQAFRFLGWRECCGVKATCLSSATLATACSTTRGSLLPVTVVGCAGGVMLETSDSPVGNVGFRPSLAVLLAVVSRRWQIMWMRMRVGNVALLGISPCRDSCLSSSACSTTLGSLSPVDSSPVVPNFRATLDSSFGLAQGVPCRRRATISWRAWGTEGSKIRWRYLCRLICAGERVGPASVFLFVVAFSSFASAFSLVGEPCGPISPLLSFLLLSVRIWCRRSLQITPS
jgi:hypothetical protein